MLKTDNRDRALIDSQSENLVKNNATINIISKNGFSIKRESKKIINKDFYLKTLGFNEIPLLNSEPDIIKALSIIEEKHYKDWQHEAYLKKKIYGLGFVRKVKALLRLIPDDARHLRYIEVEYLDKGEKIDWEYYFVLWNCIHYNRINKHRIKLTKAIPDSPGTWIIANSFHYELPKEKRRK